MKVGFQAGGLHCTAKKEPSRTSFTSARPALAHLRQNAPTGKSPRLNEPECEKYQGNEGKEKDRSNPPPECPQCPVRANTDPFLQRTMMAMETGALSLLHHEDRWTDNRSPVAR